MSDHSPVAAPPSTQGRAKRGRITGLDLARALAIVGMLAVHVGPTSTTLPDDFMPYPTGAPRSCSRS